MEARNSMAGVSSFMMMAPAEFKPDPSDSSIDHGSRFARNLGFFEDGPYNGDPDPVSNVEFCNEYT